MIITIVWLAPSADAQRSRGGSFYCTPVARGQRTVVACFPSLEQCEQVVTQPADSNSTRRRTRCRLRTRVACYQTEVGWGCGGTMRDCENLRVHNGTRCSVQRDATSLQWQSVPTAPEAYHCYSAFDPDEAGPLSVCETTAVACAQSFSAALLPRWRNVVTCRPERTVYCATMYDWRNRRLDCALTLGQCTQRMADRQRWSRDIVVDSCDQYHLESGVPHRGADAAQSVPVR